jgi:ADP-ribose pyrophosphatase
MSSRTDDAALVETRIDGQTLVEGGFLTFRRDRVRLPDGAQASRDYVVHPGAVVIVPMLDDGRVLVERQYRYPVERVMTEFPAGKLDAGEDPLACARRELLEETGYTASQWASAGAMHLAIAYSTEIIHIFFARGLKAGHQALDEDEFLEVRTMGVDEFFDACREGRITDAKTLTCALWLQNVRAGVWELDWRDSPAT